MKKSRFASTDKILIAGPCAAESLEQLHSVAKFLSSSLSLVFLIYHSHLYLLRYNKKFMWQIKKLD